MRYKDELLKDMRQAQEDLLVTKLAELTAQREKDEEKDHIKKTFMNYAIK